MCDTLLVGLTTDELGTRQKRVPFLSYDHRRVILENCKYVDGVVAHHGNSKEMDYQKLKFNVLFIGDDYHGDPEYTNFQKEHKIPVIYLPRTVGVSTSKIIREKRQMNILNVTLNGPLFQSGDTIFKYVGIGSKEKGSTADVYNLPLPRPRNWKIVGEKHVHQNISGVNGNREIKIHDFIIGKVWNPVTSKKLAWTKDENVIKGGKEDSKLTIDKDRANPVEVYLLEQRFAGQTLSSWIDLKVDGTDDPAENLATIERTLRKVALIISDLQKEGIVHGDVHADNICIDKDENLSLIDFGWCQHSSFDMSKEERQQYEERLKSNFDLKHFDDSLSWDRNNAEKRKLYKN
jgi:glycerol-3-phosphate cytidylyltransferase